MSKQKREPRGDDQASNLRRWEPAAAAAGVAATPSALLVARGRPKHVFGQGTPIYGDSERLKAHMRVGDVLVGGRETGSPAAVDQHFSGTPLYHAEVITEAGPNPRSLFGGNLPKELKSRAHEYAPTASAHHYTDAVLLRPKVPVDAEKLREMMGHVATQDYDLSGIVAGHLLESFVPNNPVTARIPDLNCEGEYCVGGTAKGIEAATGKRVSGKPAWMTNSSDILRSDLFRPVAAYSDRDTGFLRENPTGFHPLKKQLKTRAAIGAAAAAPAYALLNNPAAMAAGAVGTPLALYGGKKLLRKTSPQTLERLVARTDDLWERYAPEAVLNARREMLSRDERLQYLLPSYAGGTLAGTLAPEYDLSSEKTAMNLEFDSPEDLQRHVAHRQLAGHTGTVLGAGALAAAGGRRYGPLGVLAGGVVGGLMGDAPGKFMADLVHDYGQRAGVARNTQMLDAAAGFGHPKVAAAEPTATDFVEFAQNFDEDTREPQLSGFEHDMLERMRPAGFGHSSSLEGGDDATRNEVVGIGQYGGV